MLQVIDNQIKLTSGDSAKIEITIFTAEANLEDPETSIEEQIYTLKEGDKLKFVLLDINEEGLSNQSIFTNGYNAYINKNKNKPPVLVKEFNDNIIRFVPNDTKFLNTGSYLYGVVLITATGYTNTVQQGEFIITKGFL